MAQPNQAVSLENINLNYEKHQENELARKPPPLQSRQSLLDNKKQGTKLFTIGGHDIYSSRDWWNIFYITAFYLIYYTILALIAVFGIGGYSNTLATDKPYLNRLQSPGMSVFPASLSMAGPLAKDYPSDYTQRPTVDADGHKPTSEFGHTVTVKNSDSPIADFYAGRMSDLVDAYVNADLPFYSNYSWIETACGSKFGYNQGEPCFALSLNKIIDWQLQGLDTDVNTDDGNTINNHDGNHVHFYCHQFKFKDDGSVDFTQLGSDFELEWVNADSVSEGRIPSSFWPWTKTASEMYDWTNTRDVGYGDKPFAVLKIKKTDKSAKGKANFKCHAYAENIQNSYYNQADGSFKWKTFPGMSEDEAYMAYQGMFSLAEFSVNFEV